MIFSQQHVWKLQIVLYEVPCIGSAGNFLTFVDGKVKATEVLLQDTLPRLLRRWKSAYPCRELLFYKLIGSRSVGMSWFIVRR